MTDEAQTEMTQPTAGVRHRFDAASDVSTGVERQRVFSTLHEKLFGDGHNVTVGRFRIQDKLGSGAMGVVYSALDPTLDRRVAIKLVSVPSGSSDAMARVEREAKALARLRHPNVVTVHEVGTHRGDRFIAMDLVLGETLREWLARAPSWRDRMEILVQAGRGLAAAHQAGLVHRDFKPDNVLVEQGHARVVDFGLARPELSMEETAEVSTHATTEELTATGMVLGTPAYMAPEAFCGEADARSDQFSFCVVLYEALYGVRPFTCPTVGSQLEAMVQGEFARPTTSIGVPHWIRRVVARGLAYDGGDRWPDMAALLVALERFGRRPFRQALVATGLGGTLVGAGVVAMSSVTGPSVCVRGAERISEVWHPAKVAAIGRAFAQTELAFADDAWTKARPVAKAYAADWETMRRSACEATHERGEQSEAIFDARMQCLDRRFEAFSALVRVFEDPDREVVSRAVAATRALQPLDDCADERWLRARIDSAIDVPAAPAAMYARLAEVGAAKATGRYKQGIADAHALALEADAGDYVDVAAEGNALAATLESRLHEFTAAQESLFKAVERFERAGDDKGRARAQAQLVDVLARQGAGESALQWARVTRATVARLGDPPLLLAGLRGGEVRIHRRAGDYEAALAASREVLALFLLGLDADDPRLGAAHAGLGDSLVSLGRADEAQVELELALGLAITALGDNHPTVAQRHISLSNAYQNLGLIPEATDEARRAVEVGLTAFGPRHFFLGGAYGQLAISLAQGSDAAESIPYFRKSAEIIEATKGPNSPALSDVLSNLGRVLAIGGGLNDAIEVLERALQIQTDLHGPDYIDSIYTLNNLALAYDSRGRADEALAVARRAVALGLASFEGDHATIADAYRQIGVSLRALGLPGEAIAPLRASVAMYERLALRPALTGDARLELGWAHEDAGDLEAATAAIGQARREFLRDPTPPLSELEWANEWLTQHDAEAGRHADAEAVDGHAMP